jgi:hypothetical protein
VVAMMLSPEEVLENAIYHLSGLIEELIATLRLK